MTETTRPVECSAPGATLYVALELGSTTWVVASTVGLGQRPRLRKLTAGDVSGLQREVLAAKARFGVPLDVPVRSCYEAGRDGFWVHRWLMAHGIANLVVDASSIQVPRRRRWAKTDRLDAGKLLVQLVRWAAGERKTWSVVQVPSAEAEAQRQVLREITTVREDRTRVRNRIPGLLASQGIRCALTRRFPARLADLQTGDGRSLAPAYRDRLAREWAQLQTIETRLRELRTARDVDIAQGTHRVAVVARTLCRLRGIAQGSAGLYSAEMFGTRTFTNGRQVGALSGLAPTPHRSDQRVQDLGISKAGRRELRRVSIQLAWAWIRWQPDSALAQWFDQRFARAGGRSRRIGIVAVARKLLIALWRFVAHGIVPDGARLKAAA